MPANITRVRDSQAIQLVQAAKKEEVTLGVLAKADLAHDPRYKQRKQTTPYWQLEERLAGKADDMVKLQSWVAVKNRDTLVEEEEASSLQESCETERKWFVDEAKLGGEQCGIAALLSKIDALFTLYIKETWVPAAVSQLEQESAGIAAQIDELGRSPSSFTLDELLAAFTDAFTEVRGFIIEPGMYEVAKDYVSSIVAQKEISSALQAAMQSGSSSHPTIRTAIFRKMLKQKLVDGLPELLPLFTELVVKAVKAAFSSDIKPPLRLERFEVLRDALCEASGMLLEGCLDGFVESAAQTMRPSTSWGRLATPSGRVATTSMARCRASSRRWRCASSSSRSSCSRTSCARRCLPASIRRHRRAQAASARPPPGARRPPLPRRTPTDRPTSPTC